MHRTKQENIILRWERGAHYNLKLVKTTAGKAKPEKLRVLFICPQPFFQWRGSSIRVKHTVTALSDQGFEVDLLTLPIGNDVPGLAVNVKRVVNLLGVKNIPIGPSITKLLFDFLLLAKGLVMVLKNPYQVIHGTEEAGFLGLLLAKLTGSLCIYEKHSDPASYKNGRVRNFFMSMYQKIENFTARQVDMVICTGPGLKKQVTGLKTNAIVKHISDIPSSLADPNSAQVDAIKRLMQTEPEQILVTYVGSFAIYQGIELLFAAIPEVIAKTKKIKFIVIGGNSEEIAVQKGRLVEQGAEDAVSFLGHINPEELSAYLAASDIVLAPRKSGVNTPLKILDYFKSGAAIVATDTPGNRLLLCDNTAAFSRYDKTDYANSILTLANDQTLRKKLGSNGRRKYETIYNYDQFQIKLGSAYSQIVQPR